MSENFVPETLETIAAKIDAFSKSIDRRFEVFGKSTDRRFEESGAQLGLKIEAVQTKVAQVYDEVIAMRNESKRNTTEHTTFSKRLDNHDLRILALEKPGPPKP